MQRNVDVFHRVVEDEVDPGELGQDGEDVLELCVLEFQCDRLGRLEVQIETVQLAFLGEEDAVKPLLRRAVLRVELQHVPEGDHGVAQFVFLLEVQRLLQIGLGVPELQRLLGAQLRLHVTGVHGESALELAHGLVVVLLLEEGLPFFEVDSGCGSGHVEELDPVLAVVGMCGSDLGVLHQRAVQVPLVLELLGLAESGASRGTAGEGHGNKHEC